MLFTCLSDCILLSLILNTRISIILQNILFFHFQSSDSLLCQSFLILNLFRLSFQKFICLTCFLKLNIYKFIFFSKSLNILSKLKAFLSFNLYNLLVLLLLLSKTQIFLSQNFDFIFSFKQPSLKVFFSTCNN